MTDPLDQPVSDIMSRSLEMVADTIPLSYAANLMATKRVTGLPVTTEEGDLVGVLSWTDVMEAMCSNATDALTGTVQRYMTDSIVAVSVDATVRDAAALMKRGSVHRVLVVDGAGNLAGLVSAIDIVRHLVPDD